VALLPVFLRHAEADAQFVPLVFEIRPHAAQIRLIRPHAAQIRLIRPELLAKFRLPVHRNAAQIRLLFHWDAAQIRFVRCVLAMVHCCCESNYGRARMEMAAINWPYADQMAFGLLRLLEPFGCERFEPIHRSHVDGTALTQEIQQSFARMAQHFDSVWNDFVWDSIR
jgi:hypothetical protein